ncbi:MAG: thioredoxin family protein [Candidatus Symbiothrix sp.]|jgi:hypothetical protein|nr:thioredoxin family protein [Candidatus Symbiothrix sp.]
MKQNFNFYGLKSIILAAMFSGLSCLAPAQNIDCRFPDLAGNSYMIQLYRGSDTDTVQQGTVPQTGRFGFTLPDKYKDYVGIVRFQMGKGGSNLVMNHENYSLAMNFAGNNIAITGSAENDDLQALMQQQQAIYNKLEVVYRGLMLYQDDAEMTSAFNKAFTRLKNDYAAMRETIAADSAHYAARYMTILNMVNGFGTKLFSHSEEQEKLADMQDFFANQLDVDALYSSGLWRHAISMAFDLYPDQKKFGEVMVKLLKRTQRQSVLEALANDLITICEQYGWTDAENIIFPYLSDSQRLNQSGGRLLLIREMYKIRPDKTPPPIKGVDDLSNTVLIFYESGCPNCHAQLDSLTINYKQLTEAGYRVVSVSADGDKDIFEQTARSLPWKDRLFDGKSFSGENFQKYGVMGTPTIFVFDKNGYPTGRFATWAEAKSAVGQ